MMETYNENAMRLLPGVRGLIVDLDGVVHVGAEPIGGLQTFLSFIGRQAIEVVFVTNNSTKTPQALAHRLETFGLQTDPERILTSALATARYLAERFPNGGGVLPIGEQGLVDALEASGFKVGSDEPLAVVVGLDREINYEKIRRGASAVLAGAAFVACNVDSGAPSEMGINPGAGAMVAAVQAVCGTGPVVVGKPEPGIFEQAVVRLGLPKDACAVVGDRLDVDIQAAHRAGLSSIFVLSGMDGAELLEESPHQPDMVFDDIGQLSGAWEAILDAGGGA
jgi:4-nitrophenyl phosphatase